MNFIKQTALVITIFLFFTTVSNAITIKEEEKLSRDYMKIISKYYKIVDDPLVTAYINRLGKTILKNFPDKKFNYKFYVIEEPSYNAFAIPGGKIFVHTGLIGGLESEEELAGILSHEISHVSLRHISESIDRSKNMTFAQLAAIAAAILIGSKGDGEGSAAIMFGSVAAMQSISTAYSRDHEREADKKGLLAMVKSGYHPKGLMRALNLMRSKQWFSNIPSYFKTHPNIDERLSYISSFIDNNRDTLNRIKSRKSTRFDRFRNKVIGSYEEKDIAVQRYKELILKNPEDTFLNYGYGLALLRTGDIKEAIDHLKTSLKTNPFDPHILKTIGMAYYKKGDYDNAKPPLLGAVSVNSSDFEAKYYLGEIYKNKGELAKAAAAFEDILKKKGQYKEALYSLGETYGKLGNYPDAHYYLGLYAYHAGNFKNALFHLNKAKSLHNDPKKIRELDGLIKKSEKLLRKEKAANNKS